MKTAQDAVNAIWANMREIERKATEFASHEPDVHATAAIDHELSTLVNALIRRAFLMGYNTALVDVVTSGK